MTETNLIDTYLSLKSYAVAGATNKKEKYGYMIFTKLRDAGKTVYPVHPTLNELEGIKCFKSIKEIKPKPDAVHMIVPPAAALQVLKECKDLGIKYVWMQPGVESDENIKYCEENNIQAIYNNCLLKV